MDMRRLLEIAKRYGLEVTFTADPKDDDRVPKDSPVSVSLFTRGVGTETIAHYRTTSVGYLKPHGGFAANPEHVSLDFKNGYRIDEGHFSDWPLILDGKPAHPDDDPHQPWARLGKYEWTSDGRRVPHTEFYTRAEAAQETYKREQTKQHEAVVAAMHGEGATVTPGRAPRAPRKRASPPKQPPSRTAAQALIAELQARQGTVIDGGVRILEPNRFKSYRDTLLRAVVAAGGDRENAERELRRGEIEVLSEIPGLGRGQPIIEYVVHPGLAL
jgi:hypothetical protein